MAMRLWADAERKKGETERLELAKWHVEMALVATSKNCEESYKHHVAMAGVEIRRVQVSDAVRRQKQKNNEEK